MAAGVVSRPDEERTEVTPRDLEKLEVIHAILSTLNDFAAGSTDLGKHIAAFPPLAARLRRRFAERFGKRQIPHLPQMLSLLGNRELQSILLALLEDLTVLRADVDERKPR
jgi:hypothetical protein